LAYVGSILALGLAVALSLGLALLLYPVLGIALSRYIGSRVRWSECHATVATVSQAKLGLIVRWPLEVPIFIAQAFVTKYL
jgi:hypothetical protein